MNKKIGIFMVFVLLAGAVFLSACQEEVGRNKNKNYQQANIPGGVDKSTSSTNCGENYHPKDGKKYTCITRCADGTYIEYKSDTDDTSQGNTRGDAGCKGMGTS